jgi:hypothetical protein
LENAPLKTKDETHLSPSKKGTFAAERGKTGYNPFSLIEGQNSCVGLGL